MTEQTLEFSLNGEQISTSVSPRTRLLDLLRNQLGLTGTKEGCGTGDCGSCTVLLDNKPVNSCMVLALQAKSRDVTSIEGLNQSGELHPIQRAMMKSGGIQCGFCTPGMVLSLKALLDENENPNEHQIREAISSNLCRCTGYKKIVEAALSVGKSNHSDSNDLDDVNQINAIGSRMVRADAKEKATGGSLYAQDIQLPNMIFGVLVRSDQAHAKILSIDTSDAESITGVKAIVCGREVDMGLYGYELRDHQIFALDKVRYIGEPIAAVAATTLDIALEAASKVKIIYEPLQAVFDPEDAIVDDSVLVHEDQSAYELDWKTERSGNLCYKINLSDGNIEKGFEQADFVIEGTYKTPVAHAGAIEPHCSTASVDSTGRATIWTTTQKPFVFRSYLASALNRPLSKFKIVPTQIGGGFGGKLFPTLEAYAVLLAEKSKVPVQIVLSREEEMEATLLRHPSKIELKTGVKTDGTLVAQSARMVFNTGAYGFYGPNTAALASLMVTGPYRIPNLDVTGLVVYTNTVPNGSIRAPGAPQLAFAVEAQLEKVAKAVGMDSLEFRLKNAWNEGDTTCLGQTLESVSIKECLNKAAEAIDWSKPKEPGVGKGLACLWWVSGQWGTQTLIESNEDGTFRLINGCVDMGTGGLYSSVIQMAADGLGVSPDLMQLVRGDTDNLPWDHGHGGSRTVFTIGESAYEAALDLKRQILSEGASYLQVEVDSLEVVDEKVCLKDDHSRFVTLSKICYDRHKKHGGPMVGVSSSLPQPPSTTKDHPIGGFSAASFCAHAVELSADRGTGEVDIKRYAAAHDVGRAINPAGCEGQIEGGVAMGLGLALMEELVNENGKILNPSFADYLLVTAEDMPDIKTILVEKPSREGHFGAKGVGEPPIAPPTGAVANALMDAYDIDINSLPLSSEAITTLFTEKYFD